MIGHHNIQFKLNGFMDTFNEVDFRRMDLNVLLTFVALMRTRSVKGAAERLFLGAPAVSMALTRLRETFGDALLVRTRDGMQPTPRALALYEQIEPALSQIHRSIVNDQRFDPAQAEGVLRLGVGDDLEPFILPLLIKAFAEQAPGLRLVNRSCNFGTVCYLLDADAIDIALCPQPVELRSWHAAQPLMEESFLCVFDPSVLSANSRSGKLTKAQYFSTPHIVRATDGATRTRFDDLFEQHDHQRTVAATSATFLAAAMSVRGSRLLANMPELAGRLIAHEFGLATCAIPIPVPSHQLALLCHAKRTADPRNQWFRSMIEQVVNILRHRMENAVTRRAR